MRAKWKGIELQLGVFSIGILFIDLLLTKPLPIPFATHPVTSLGPQVRDQEMPIKRNFVWVSIHVEDGNLHPPRFTQLHYEASVPATMAPGTELLQVRATDGDRGANAEVHYSFLKGESLARSPERGRGFGKGEAAEARIWKFMKGQAL